MIESLPLDENKINKSGNLEGIPNTRDDSDID